MGWIDDDFLKSGSTGLSKPFADAIRALITPSDSTALAKLLAEERLAELKLHQEKHACDIDGVFHIESKCLECRFYVARVAELKGEQLDD